MCVGGGGTSSPLRSKPASTTNAAASAIPWANGRLGGTVGHGGRPVPDSPSLALYTDRFFISPYVFTCHVALQEKGLPFEVVEVALDRQEQHAPDYRDRTLTGRVPALRPDDFWLAESTA